MFSHILVLCFFSSHVFTSGTIFTKPGFSPTTVVASAVAAVILLLSLVLVLVIVLVKKKNERKEASRAAGVVDMNPVYGMYYFADGEHIDTGRSEVVDHNADYASWESVPL